jgi:hypothetical protein
LANLWLEPRTSGFSYGRAPLPPPMLPTQMPTRDAPQVGQSILSGLGGFFEGTLDTLDRPGNAMRGLLSGNPDALLGLIPFAETIGIDFTKISGEDMLKKWGVEGAGFWSGLAAEVLTDPLLLFGTGGLTKFGKGVKAYKGARAEMEALKAMMAVGKNKPYLERLAKPVATKLKAAGLEIGPANRKLAKAGRLGNERALIHVPFTDMSFFKFDMPGVWQKIPGHGAIGAAVDKVFKSLPEDSVMRNMYDLEKNLVKKKQRAAQRLIKKNKDLFEKKWGNKIEHIKDLPEFKGMARDELEVFLLEKGFPDAASKFERVKQIVDQVSVYVGGTRATKGGEEFIFDRAVQSISPKESQALQGLMDHASKLAGGSHLDAANLTKSLFTAMTRGDRAGRQSLSTYAKKMGLEGPSADKWVDELLGWVKEHKAYTKWDTPAGEIAWDAELGMFSRAKIPALKHLPEEWRQLHQEMLGFREAYNAFRRGDWEAGENALETLVKAEALDIKRIELIQKEFGDHIFNDLHMMESLYGGFLREANQIGLPIRNLDHPLMRYHYHMITPDGWDWLRKTKNKKNANDFLKQIVVTRSGSRKARGQTVNEINKYMVKQGYASATPFMETDIWRAASRRAERHAMEVYEKVHLEAVFGKFGFKSRAALKAAGHDPKTAKRLSDVLGDRNYMKYKDRQWQLADTKRNSKLKGVKLE